MPNEKKTCLEWEWDSGVEGGGRCRMELDDHPLKYCIGYLYIARAPRQLFMAQWARCGRTTFCNLRWVYTVCWMFCVCDDKCLLLNGYGKGTNCQALKLEPIFATSQRAAGAASINLHVKCNFNTIFCAKCFFLRYMFMWKRCLEDAPQEIWVQVL